MSVLGEKMQASKACKISNHSTVIYTIKESHTQQSDIVNKKDIKCSSLYQNPTDVV